MFPRSLVPNIFLLLALFLLLPAGVHAQSFADNTPLSLSVAPQFPAPNTSAVLTVLSNTIDPTNAIMTVAVDGSKIYSGSVQPIAIPLGNAGVAVQVRATLAGGGTTSTNTVTITPQDVSIVAEPNASVPPLYPGKPSVPLGGTTRVVAVADLRTSSGSSLDPLSLSYTWTVDGAVIGNASGIGKAAITVASPLQYRSRDISVLVKSPGGSLVGGAGLSLSPQAPIVRIYAHDPLLGIRFGHALYGAYTISGAETALFGGAYSFSTAGAPPTLQWFLNGSSVQSGPLVTLRPQGSGTGSANLSLVASSGSFSQATSALSLTFGKTTSNIFGL